MQTLSPNQFSEATYMVANDLDRIRTGIREGSANPLAGMIADDAYAALRDNDLINEKALRDYVIRQMFIRLKKESKLGTQDAILALRDMYPYLQHDTIRKIVYRVYPTSTRKCMM